MGARILAVAEDYDTALMGTNFAKPLKPPEAALLMQDGKGKNYDPAVLAALASELNKASTATGNASELTLHSGQVTPDMTISRDLMTQAGDMLLSKGHVLTEQVIEQIRGFERMEGHKLTLDVHVNVASK